MALFEKQGLEQTTGEMAERWNQEGSNIITATGADGTTLHTVTAGKKAYIKSITFTGDLAGVGAVCPIKDNTTLVIKYADENNTYSLTFDSPLVFETSIVADGTTGVFSVTVSGWEE